MEFSDSDKVLIVGANSSLASALIPQISLFNPKITAIFRKDTHVNSAAFQQKMFLDLADISSIDRTMGQLALESFNYIYIFIGATSNIDTKNGSIAAISEYYAMYSARLNYLLGKLENCLSVGGTLIFLSSRAAHRSSHDAHYSAVKSSNEGFLLSLSAKTQGKRILVLAPSLIENSAMYNRMSNETINNHRERTGNKLLSSKDITSILIDMSVNKTKYLNGSVECIGSDW